MEPSKRKLAASLFAVAASAVLTTPLHAVTYVEPASDAGQTLATAASTATAAGPAGTSLTSITGNIPLSNQQDADLYAINITSPSTFSASTVGNTALDTALFLFSANGTPIATNDDANGTSFASTLAAGNSLYANLSAGVYFLGISLSGNEAVNSASQTLFNGYPAGDTTATRGAAAGVNPTTLFNFDSFATGGETTTPYGITLTGAATAANPFAVPEPSTYVLLSFGAAATVTLLRRRRAPLPA